MCTEPPSCAPGHLARLLRGGDIAALDHLTRCHGERLLSVGRRHCPTNEDAHDAVQDALLAVGEHPDAWRGEGPPEAWVARMVAHACHRRCRGRKNDPALHETDVDVGDDRGDPEASVARGEALRTLVEGMDALAPEDRALLLLADAEDWTGPEIAAHTGLSAAAVRKRLSRARDKLRAALATREGGAPNSGHTPGA
ncbi:MAG: sigma-70 family RNA polymerase sigma factor [Pseudomonadota bacterium]|nr:sigma-70 family RNA polymerase sigma factor [Pseudomonadota bacterium]